MKPSTTAKQTFFKTAATILGVSSATIAATSLAKPQAGCQYHPIPGCVGYWTKVPAQTSAQEKQQAHTPKR